jgi:hypothetical protein
MAKFKEFTNAAPQYFGDPVTINIDIISSIYESIEANANGNLNSYTILYGVNNIDWHVKESYKQVLDIINSD